MQEVIDLLNSVFFHPGQEVLVDNKTYEQAQLGNLTNTDSFVNEVKSSVNNIVYDVKTSAPALLVTAESDYPGWKAYIDGAPVEIFSVNYAFKGVVVQSGRHIVKFRYLPNSYFLGLGIFIFTIISTVFFIKKPIV
jgi:uncharacterized membrane protein YfhO